MRIAHFSCGIFRPGGIKGYVESLTRLQIDSGNEVFLFDNAMTTSAIEPVEWIFVKSETELFDLCRGMKIDILHYHTPPSVLPPHDLNVVYTTHEHSSHCVSGSLFLRNKSLPCPRTPSAFGCGCGYFVDRCGSVRPGILLHNFNRFSKLRSILPEIDNISVGYFIKERMVRAGYPPECINVVPNFTDISAANQKSEEPEIPEFLFLGRIEKLKGLAWLLQALKEVREPMVLNVAGEGGSLHSDRELCQSLGIEKKVNFLGWLERDEKVKLITRCRAVIVPSVWHEPFGLTAIEGGACGRPAIVSDTGELPFIIENEKNGLVVQVGQTKDLAFAIARLTSDKNLADKMGREGYKKYLRLYTPQIHLSRLDEIYHGIIKRRKIV